MLRGILAGLAAGALWGLVFVAPRMVSGFSAVDLTAGRFASYGLISIALVLALWQRRRPTWSQAGAALGMSLLGFTAYYLLLALSIRAAGTEVPTLIIGTIPLWVMLLGKPGHLRWKTLVPGIALTAAGLALMVSAVQGGTGPGLARAPGEFLRGVVLVTASLACWTAFALFNSAWLKRHPEVDVMDWAHWLGVATGLGALVLWLVAGSSVAELAARPQLGRFVLVCVATGLGSAWLATILWNVASRRLPASLGGQLIVLSLIHI